MPRVLTVEEIRDFREDLCEVAASLFARDGYEAVTMRAIASELGVSAMTPYRYFQNKGEIYRAVRARAFVRFGERVEAAAEGEDDPIARLRALFAAYLGFALDEPGSYRIMFELEAPRDAEPDDEERALSEATWQPLLTTLDEATRLGLVRGDPITLANLCWLQVHGLASLHISGRLSFGRSFDDLFEPLFDTLMHGILTRPEGDH
ncbi:MAG: TetR/AcrR family transcriptional regulator [Myxococcota bacterium]|nr:TetR/AcrR family transcriptional regulator [Myxococcota bacterium]